MNDSDTPFDEAHLRAAYAALRRRATALEEQVPPRLQRISDVLHRIGGQSELADDYRAMLVGARNAAMLAIENYHQAIPFLHTAESILEQMDKTPEQEADEEWREALLQRLLELIDVAATMVDDAEAHDEQANDPDPESIPPSILDA